jgi:hypothetical protein
MHTYRCGNGTPNANTPATTPTTERKDALAPGLCCVEKKTNGESIAFYTHQHNTTQLNPSQQKGRNTDTTFVTMMNVETHDDDHHHDMMMMMMIMMTDDHS